MFTPDQLCLRIWILMSFQETLVSKKQKKQKKYSKCTKTKICKKKKQRLLSSASLSLSQQQNEIKIYHKNILKWKTVKFLNFPFSGLQFTVMLPHYEQDLMRKIFQWRITKSTKNTTIYLDDYKYGLTISLAKIKT